MTQTYADILGAVLDHSTSTLSDFDRARGKAQAEVPEGHSDTSSEPKAKDEEDSAEEPLVADDSSSSSSDDRPPRTPKFNSSGYRNMIKDAVQEAIRELIASGALVQSSSRKGQAGDFSAGGSTLATRKASKESLLGQGPSPHDMSSLDDESRVLLSLWSSMLRVEEEKIRAEDSFFGLGGDSILAMELARAARESGYSLTVADIFGAPVFSDMAKIFAEHKKGFDHFEASASSTEHESIIDTDMSHRFSLLKTGDREAFIQDYICPQVGCFRGGVVDAFPVTDFQGLALAGHLLAAKWMLNYIYFDGEGILDLSRLRKSVSQIIETFEILRSVFVPYGDNFLQVILRSFRPKIQVHDTEEDFDDFTHSLTKSDQAPQAKMGDPFFEVTVIRKPESHLHRILMRLSHAQYDGVSLPRIIEAFKAGYEGSSTLPPPPFSDFVRESIGSATTGHKDYWRTLLAGSSMTQVVPRKQPNYFRTDKRVMVTKKIVKVPSLTSKNITTATVLKAAWAMTMSQLLGESDVVFGNLISGRNAPVENVEDMVEPCLNIIPVRVRLDSNWSALELLRKIQSQQVASMPFENLGFREIIQKCTDWPEWSYFSSTVQHQNLAQDVTLKFDYTSYSVGMIGAQDTLADISIVSTPKKGDMVEIALGFAEDGSVPNEWADKALDILCSFARNLAGNPNKTLSTFPESPRRTLPPSEEQFDTDRFYKQLSFFDPQHVNDVTAEITRGWNAVLQGDRDRDAIGGLDLESSFYDKGGDLISLASLVAFMNNMTSRSEIRLEELIDRPKMGSQVALLISRSSGTGASRINSAALLPRDEATTNNLTLSSDDDQDGSGGGAGGLNAKKLSQALEKQNKGKKNGLRSRLSRKFVKSKKQTTAVV